jgi:UV DNA damage endonuclease
VNSLEWWKLYENQFNRLGEKIKKHGIRISMHPGQYTVINSPNMDVVDRAFKDLDYHAKVLDSFGTGPENKIVLHIGGVYNDKEGSINRFIENYKKLDSSVKQRLVIENDDKSYHVSEVLGIGRQLGIPVIFDNLHNYANPSPQKEPEEYWIKECGKTWLIQDGPQKIHYSQQDPGKKAGSHSGRIRIREFMEFYQKLPEEGLDIMLEVKDKNLSAIKCISCTSSDSRIVTLEQEWSRYKYSVLEKSQNHYNAIRTLLKDKQGYPSVEFYELLEDSMEQPETVGSSVNAAMHVWGYFKDAATEAEKQKFRKNIEAYQNGTIPLSSCKNYLKRLVDKYGSDYLKNSLYFVI